MIVQIKRIILLLGLFLLPVQAVIAQYSSKNNYTGGWETSSSWNQTWTVPQTTNLNGYDIEINGYITVNGSLSFSGNSGNLIINDTLVIIGNLSLDNNNDVLIKDNGILIVRGTLTFNNQTNIIAYGYIIITGGIIKNGSHHHGSFDSNDNPAKVFIGGTIFEVGLTDNEPNYPGLNCTLPTTISYPNSKCSFGNMTDIIIDPIYPFFRSTCSKLIAKSNSPVCTGDTINLTSSGGSGYRWSGPNGFTSNTQNPSIPNANIGMNGAYIVTVISVTTCSVQDTTNVIVNALPLVDIASSNSSMCINDLRPLTGSPAGGTFIITDGPATITGNILSATGTGIIKLEYNFIKVCTHKAIQSIIVNGKPVVIQGRDQELKFVFQTQMNAVLSSSEKGEWSLISGSGNISDIHSPTTRVTELSTGVNIFLWKVRNGSCEAGAEVKITVHDLFIPSVITPDGDGKNDYFKIGENNGQAELIIFNRWGVEEYTNSNYENNWDGRNNKGLELPNDTYFYVLKLENVKIKKGSVLIKR